jgi:hypothetical protein
MAKVSRNMAIGFVVLALVVGVAFGPQIMEYVNGLSGGTFVPPPSSGQYAPQTFTLYKRGTSTVVTSAPVYAWYDWDGDGAVDLGEYPSSGEIETLTSDGTSGVVTTAVEYPIGADVLYQVHGSGYEVETFARVRSSIPSGWDGDALSVANVHITLTDTGTSRVSINGELLVTSTTDYNYTASGAEPQVEFKHTSTSTDSGVCEQAFTHWGTGKVYAGTMVIATFTTADFLDLVPDGYDGMFNDGTTATVWWNTAGYFNDADVTNDEIFRLYFNMDINDAGDIATIGIYNGIEVSDLAIGIIGSAIGTYETGLDIVA